MPEVKKKRYRLAPGPDIDLEKEDVRDIKGNRITEEYVREAVEHVHRVLGFPGRPSLTAPGETSPLVSFRVPAKTRVAAERRAKAEGRTVSELAREALERYLAG